MEFQRTRKIQIAVMRLLLLLLFASPLMGQTFTPIRVRCGAFYGYTDSNGNAWAGDGGLSTGALFTGNTGYTGNWGEKIGGTSDPTLFESQRWGVMVYTFPVPNGSYTINLRFSENWGGITQAGQRVFSVTVNGAAALTNFDVFAKVGFLTADVESIPVTVTNGTIAISFISVRENPNINAIEILSAAPPPPLKITIPGLGTFTFMVNAISQLPSCSATDPQPCVLVLQFCDNNGNCLAGNSGSFGIQKNAGNGAQTSTAIIVTASP